MRRQVEVKDGILRVGSRPGRTHVTLIEFRKLCCSTGYDMRDWPSFLLSLLVEV